ncbi:MAG: DUF2029 domain-containing protein [Pseudonocardiaceae bacterium]|nr:DUF2029 domain-containing protein [Pseudonocardiaceae bacterium]
MARTRCSVPCCGARPADRPVSLWCVRGEPDEAGRRTALAVRSVAERAVGGRLGRILLVVAILAEIFAIWMAAHIPYYEYMDTQIYRFGALALLDGGDIYGTLPATSSGIQLPFIYPPFAALLFVPLTWLPVEAAIFVFTVLSHAAVLVTAYLLVRFSRHVAPRAGLVAAATIGIAALITLAEPGRQTFAYGQINMLLMAMVMADCLLPKTAWPRGLLVGIAAGIKLTPLAFLAFFLLRKDFRAALISGATFAGTVLVGWIASPSGSVTWWFDRMLSTAEGFSPTFAGNLTIRGLLAKLEVPDPGLTIMWVGIGGCLAVLMLATMGYALRADNMPLAVLANAIWALLASPISWSHHWVWAAPALIVLLGMAIGRRRYSLLAAVLGSGAMLVLAPHWDLAQVSSDAADWTLIEQLVGNVYTLIAVAFLIAGAVCWLRSRPADAGQRRVLAGGRPPEPDPGRAA